MDSCGPWCCSSGYKSITVGLVIHAWLVNVEHFTFCALNDLSKLIKLTKTDSENWNVILYYIFPYYVSHEYKPNPLHHLLHNQ